MSVCRFRCYLGGTSRIVSGRSVFWSPSNTLAVENYVESDQSDKPVIIAETVNCDSVQRKTNSHGRPSIGVNFLVNSTLFGHVFSPPVSSLSEERSLERFSPFNGGLLCIDAEE